MKVMKTDLKNLKTEVEKKKDEEPENVRVPNRIRVKKFFYKHIFLSQVLKVLDRSLMKWNWEPRLYIHDTAACINLF